MPKRKSTAVDLRSLANSQLMGYVLAPFCTTTDLASMAEACKDFQHALSMQLTMRVEWPLSAILKWPAVRFKNVQRITCLADARPLRKIEWPANLTHLTIDHGPYHLSLPDNLKHCLSLLSEHFRFYQAMGDQDLLDQAIGLLQKLQYIPLLPASLTHLTLGRNYCLEQSIGLLTNLQHLTIGRECNQPLGQLPASLTHLSLGKHFNHDLGPLPKLRSLTLGRRFNQPLGPLPGSLRRLVLGESFDEPLGQLPEGLEELHLGHSFFLPLGPLPRSLRQLTVGSSFQQAIGDYPTALTHLKVYHVGTIPLGPLPSGLTHLSIDIYNNVHPLLLPRTLTHLSLHMYKLPLGVLPEGLQELILYTHFDYIGTTVPVSLSKIQFGKQLDRWSSCEEKTYPFVGQW